MAKADLTAQRLRELVTYDPDTGVFKRRVATGFRGQHKAGAILGSQNTKAGHLCMTVDAKRYLAHRLAWLYVRGSWPNGLIDHINGDSCDNRFENLREATYSRNSQNQRSAHIDSKSGLLGVHPYRNRFVASIWHSGRSNHLGVFDTAEEAHASYIEAKRRLHPGCTI